MQVPNPTRRNAVVLVVLLFSQLVLMSESSRGSDGSGRLESWWMRARSPLIAMGRCIGNGKHGTVSGVCDMFSAYSTFIRKYIFTVGNFNTSVDSSFEGGKNSSSLRGNMQTNIQESFVHTISHCLKTTQ